VQGISISDQGTIGTSYNVVGNAIRVAENGSITYTVYTTNVANTTLYWTNGGTTTGADFTDGANNGSFSLTSGLGTVTRTLTPDVLTDVGETIIIQIRTVSIGGTIVAVAETATVTDDIVPSFAATGGTIATPGDGFTYHTFTSPGTFTVTSGSATVEYLVVAGGGGGGTGYEGSGPTGRSTGGLGGGGRGGVYQTSTNPTAGTANTGGGGGGQPFGLQPTAGGGSGIVIVRYSA